MKKNDSRRKRCHQTGPRKEARAPKEEAVPEADGGHAEDPTSKERAHMRGPEEEITPSPLRGHLGDQAHFLGPWAAPRGFKNPRARQKHRRKRIFQRQGKRTLERDADCFFWLLVGQLQDSRSHAPTGSSEQWAPDVDLDSLLPRCTRRGNNTPQNRFLERRSSSSFQKRCKEEEEEQNEHRSLPIATVHEGVNDIVKADARLEQRHIL